MGSVILLLEVPIEPLQLRGVQKYVVVEAQVVPRGVVFRNLEADPTPDGASWSISRRASRFLT
jgi:hypothetical protein